MQFALDQDQQRLKLLQHETGPRSTKWPPMPTPISKTSTKNWIFAWRLKKTTWHAIDSPQTPVEKQLQALQQQFTSVELQRQALDQQIDEQTQQLTSMKQKLELLVSEDEYLVTGNFNHADTIRSEEVEIALLREKAAEGEIMKTPGIIDGVIVAIVISLGAGVTSLVLGGFAILTPPVQPGAVVRSTLIYLVYLLKRSKAKVGRVVVIAGWAAQASAAGSSTYRCLNRCWFRPASSGWCARFTSTARCLRRALISGWYRPDSQPAHGPWSIPAASAGPCGASSWSRPCFAGSRT